MKFISSSRRLKLSSIFARMLGLFGKKLLRKKRLEAWLIIVNSTSEL